MLINSHCVAEAPSHRVVSADSRLLATFGPGVVVRGRGRGDLAAAAGLMSGNWSGGDNAVAGYLPDLAGASRLGQLVAGPVEASAAQVSGITKSTVQKSTYQHNSIQVTRLVPASRGGVGPHPGREPGPA